MGEIVYKDNRYWINDRLIYRVYSYYDEIDSSKCYKIITCRILDEDDPTDTKIFRYNEIELSCEDIIILDKLANKKRKNKRKNNNMDSRMFNYFEKRARPTSAIGRFIDKLTDISNFRF